MSRPAVDHASKLGADLLRYSSTIDDFTTPQEVLDELHRISFAECELSVLGAVLFPIRWGNLSGLKMGKTVFLHQSAPKGWWEEHLELNRAHPSSGFMVAQMALAPFTMSEIMQMLEPIGADRWPFELAAKYGIRDNLTCPVGGRWVVVYWSRTVLSRRLTPELRTMLFMGATFAAIRLQKLVACHVDRLGRGAALTPRELSVLRLLSVGKQLGEVASHLDLGTETVRSHIKKAQSKLGARNRTHAVAQAIRMRLIP